MDASVVSEMTIQDLYKDERTRHLVIPYLRLLIKCRLIKDEADCLNFDELERTLGQIDYDMCVNMGGGMPGEGWREMIDALLEFEYEKE